MELLFIAAALLLILLLKSTPGSLTARDIFLSTGRINKQSSSFKAQLPYLLKKHSTYYQNLPLKYQKEFQKRTLSFIEHKEFVARNLPKVTDDMKVCLGAYATQLSFGYKDLVLFEHFETILIYPKPYKSTITKKMHKGEVNRKGYIVLSWRDVQQGSLDPHDGINLALHEFAHALQLENSIQNSQYDFFNEKHLNKLWGLAKEIHDDVKHNDLSFLREYASTNQLEFFAVCVENFFERPVEFQQQHPDIYMLMVLLLKQDPIVIFGLDKA